MTTTGKRIIITAEDLHTRIPGADMVDEMDTTDGNDRTLGIEDGHHRTIEVTTAIRLLGANTTMPTIRHEAGQEVHPEINGTDDPIDEDLAVVVLRQAQFPVPTIATLQIAEVAEAPIPNLTLDPGGRLEAMEASTKEIEEIEVEVYLLTPCHLLHPHPARDEKRFPKRIKTSRPFPKISGQYLFPSWSCGRPKKTFADIFEEK